MYTVYPLLTLYQVMLFGPCQTVCKSTSFACCSCVVAFSLLPLLQSPIASIALIAYWLCALEMICDSWQQFGQ